MLQSIGKIHDMRNSWQKFETLMNTSVPDWKWFGDIQGTMWLIHCRQVVKTVARPTTGRRLS